MSSSQFVVIGAGLAGTATAWHLSRRGLRVTLVERTTPANRWGSSHGSARIFRYSYPDPLYVDLVSAADRGWEELEALSDTPLRVPAGCLDFGDEEHTRVLAETLAAAQIAHELLTRKEAAMRWPGFAFDSEVLWHPGGGTVDAEAAVRLLTAQAEHAGAALLTNWPVADVHRQGDGFRVTSEHGEVIDAEHVVVAAGGWLPELLSRLPLNERVRGNMPQFEVRQEAAFHFRYATRPGKPTEWPAFIHQVDGVHVYGLPGGRDAGSAGQKVAVYNGGKVLRSAAEQDGAIDSDNRGRVVDYVARYLPGLVPEPYAETTCLFTNTPSEDFVIDGEEGITIVSPCSGHGAKFAPAIGRIVADLATGEASAPTRFRLPLAAA